MFSLTMKYLALSYPIMRWVVVALVISHLLFKLSYVLNM